MADGLDGLFDVLEILGYSVLFWTFWFSRTYREEAWGRFVEAGAFKKSVMVLEATVATFLGLGIPLAIVWLLVWLM